MSRSFLSIKAAKIWGERKEHELDYDKANGYAKYQLRNTTLEEVAVAYLEQWSGKDKTRPMRVQWWIDRLGARRVLDVDKRMVRDALDEYANGNALRVTQSGRVIDTGRKRAGGTANRHLAALSAVFCWGRDTLDLPRNPCHEVKARRESRGRDVFLSREEVARLLIACRDSTWDRLYLLVLMAVQTGARRGELMGLKWENIDWQNRAAVLTDTKEDKPRLLPLWDEVMEELRNHCKSGNGFIFAGRRPLVKRAFDEELTAARKRAGLKVFRFHDLRHTTASLLAQDGRSLHEIAKLLGHKSLATTQRYAHIGIEAKRKMVEQVLGNLAGGMACDDGG